MARINWTLRTFRLDELTDYYKNPRSLSEKEFKQLKTSLDKFGMIDKPIVNLDSANTIIGGHQRKHVLEATGVKECECWIPDRELSEKEVEELNIRLNKNTGSWDFDVLANEFELDDLLEWGFDKKELDIDLWAGEAPEDVEPQIDKAEELREKWGVETGQLWQLGEHRLICGDCTDKAVVDKVMQGERAQALISDPPFAVREDDWDKFSGDEGFVNFTSTWINNGKEFADVVISFMADKNVPLLLEAAALAGIDYRRALIWRKPPGSQFAGASLDGFWYDFEIIQVFGKPNFKPGKDTKMAVLEYRTVTKQEHGCEKPLGLLEDLVNGYSENSGNVMDLFGGTGTVLIACERLGRKCRAVEISPAYVAVAIQRWVDVTGGEPELIGED
jgi:DNA modification methylase